MRERKKITVELVAEKISHILKEGLVANVEREENVVQIRLLNGQKFRLELEEI